MSGPPPDPDALPGPRVRATSTYAQTLSRQQPAGEVDDSGVDGTHSNDVEGKADAADRAASLGSARPAAAATVTTSSKSSGDESPNAADWVSVSGDAGEEGDLLDGMVAELQKGATDPSKANPQVLAAFLQELGMRLGVKVPLQIVVGAEKSGKSRYVEFLLGGLPLGFSDPKRATRQPIVYMIRYRPTLGAEKKTQAQQNGTAPGSVGNGTGNGTGPIAAARPPESIIYHCRYKPSAGGRAKPLEAGDSAWVENVAIWDLASHIQQTQRTIGSTAKDNSGLTEEWMLVSIETNDHTIEPIIVVDCPGQTLTGTITRAAPSLSVSNCVLTVERRGL